MRWRMTIAAGLSVLMANALQADDGLLETISTRLSVTPVVRAAITQDKTLAILSRPMHSEGRLLFSREHGLYWVIETPVASETLVTRDRLLQVTGSHRRLMTVSEQPALAAVGDIFFPILSGEMDALRDAFTITVHGDDMQWQLQLSPKNEPLNRFIHTITLDGGADLQRMTLTDHNGDTTVMSFADVQREPATLTDSELAHFAF